MEKKLLYANRFSKQFDSKNRFKITIKLFHLNSHISPLPKIKAFQLLKVTYSIHIYFCNPKILIHVHLLAEIFIAYTYESKTIFESVINLPYSQAAIIFTVGLIC